MSIFENTTYILLGTQLSPLHPDPRQPDGAQLPCIPHPSGPHVFVSCMAGSDAVNISQGEEPITKGAIQELAPAQRRSQARPALEG